MHGNRTTNIDSSLNQSSFPSRLTVCKINANVDLLAANCGVALCTLPLAGVSFFLLLLVHVSFTRARFPSVGYWFWKFPSDDGARRGKSVRFSARPTSNLHQSQRVSFNQPSGNQINHCRGQRGLDTDFTPDQVRVCVSTQSRYCWEKSPEAVNCAGWTDCK